MVTFTSARSESVGLLHKVATIVLFSMFAIFALWLFRLAANAERPVPGKRRRNNVYLFCGMAILPA